MNPIIQRLILTGLMALPAACATYPQSYYSSTGGYDYYPGSYGSSYGVIERNYYSTYAYPTPVYRTENHHYHYDDHDHYDRHDRPRPDSRHQNNRRSLPPPVSFTRRDAHEHDRNDHYNGNAQAPRRYDTPQNDRNRERHDHQHEGWQRRPETPNARGQSQPQQNWERQGAKRQDNDFNGRASFRARAEPQYIAPAARDGRQGPRRQRSQAPSHHDGG